jgi:nucleoid-associated protein YgaU
MADEEKTLDQMAAEALEKINADIARKDQEERDRLARQVADEQEALSQKPVRTGPMSVPDWALNTSSAPVPPAAMTEYELKPDDTLSHVALKFYGNAGRDYWMVIYEANMDVIGDNPGIVRPGTMLKIPELPEGLK